ncbi:MAG: hypothetical protein C5B50_20725 [Verrucomicrobia bacterium]|nr:MAG: hypothetical protein C5B50_20725 [Verrucomicrobiota bacterium]
MNTVPPPLPASVRSAEPSQFARNAANICLAAPLIVLAFVFLVSPILREHRDASGRLISIIIGLGALAFCVAGAVAGILAFLLAKPGQRGAVFARAGCGMALLGLLAAIAVPNFVRARTVALQNKQALKELQAAVTNFNAQTAASLTNGEAHSLDTRNLQQSLAQAAERTTGETTSLLKGSQLYMKELQQHRDTYDQALKELTVAKVLTVRTLEQRAQLSDRKALVQKFLDANDGLQKFVESSQSHYRKGLIAAGVSAPHAEAATKGFSRQWSAQHPFMVTIREADDRMGRAMLGVLNLFDTQWGQWSFDADANVVRFQNDSALEQYKSFMAEIKQAGADQAAAQQRLASVLSQRTGKL